MITDFIDVNKLIEYPKSGILSKHLVKTDLDVTLFCMSKGSEMSEHTSSREASVYVLEGSGIFHMRKKPIKMLPGTFIYFKKKTPHSLKAIRNTSFLLFLAGKKN